MQSARAVSDFLILLLGAYGLGVGVGGLRLVSGALLIPIALFFGGLWFRVPPSLAAKALLFAALVRLGVEFARRDWRKLVHPALVLPLVHFSAVYLFVRRPFTLHGWDEFSHWGLMPKQILFFDKITDRSFPYDRFLDYTPGWPLLLDFPQLVIGSGYRTDFLILTVVLLSAGVAAGVWDLARQTTQSTLCAWVATLTVSRLYLGGCLYPTGVMSEYPLDAAYCAVVLLGLRWVLGLRDERRDPVWWGVVLCGGYLIKKSFLSTLMIFVWLSVEYLRGPFRPRKFARLVLTTWLPFGATALTWHFVSRDYPHVFKFVPSGGLSVTMITGMVRQSAEFLWFYWYLSVIAAAGFFFGLREKRTRPLFSVLAGFVFVYLVSLYWLYRTTFPGAEGEQLASFRRYFQSLFSPCLFAATVFLFARFGGATRSWPWWVLRVAAAVVAIANLEQLQLSIVMMNKYGSPSPIVAQAPRLIQLLNERGWLGREVWMIDEGEGGIVNWQAIYASINRAGPRAFTTSYVFDPETSGLPESVVKQELAKHTTVWPVAVGKKTSDLLSRLMSAPESCPAELAKSFWIRDGSGQWTCIPKD